MVFQRGRSDRENFDIVQIFPFVPHNMSRHAALELSVEDSGNSCGSSVVSEIFSDSDGVQVSDLEADNDLHCLQVSERICYSIIYVVMLFILWVDSAILFQTCVMTQQDNGFFSSLGIARKKHRNIKLFGF